MLFQGALDFIAITALYVSLQFVDDIAKIAGGLRSVHGINGDAFSYSKSVAIIAICLRLW